MNSEPFDFSTFQKMKSKTHNSMTLFSKCKRMLNIFFFKKCMLNMLEIKNLDKFEEGKIQIC